MGQSVAAGALVEVLGGWEARRGPRYLALAEAIDDAVRAESLAAGDRLPAERALAVAAGVSRGTAVAAYAELVDRGVVVRRQGSGTVVRAATDAPRRGRVLRHPHYSRTLGAPDDLIDLTFGTFGADEVSLDLGATVAQGLAAGVQAHGYSALGLPALRAAVAARLELRGIPTRPEQALITTGATGALHLLTAALVRPGDRVVVEAPSWPGYLEMLSRAGAVVVGVGLDASGVRLDALERALGGPGAALTFLVPTGHNPTGSIMTERRRREVLALCRAHDALLVDDMAFSALVFDGTAPPDLAALEPGPGVVSVGSFSKTLWGGLRVGWARADEALVLRLGRLQAVQGMGAGVLDQAAVLNAMDRFDEVVARRVAMARERHDALRAALAEQLPDWEVAPARAGLSLWARLPSARADDLAAAASRHGVAISSGSSSAPDDLFLDHVRLCFGLEPAVLREAVGRLALAWEEVAPGGATARRRVPAAAST